MFPYYQGGSSQVSLSQDDQDAMQDLYGAKDPVTEYRPPIYISPPRAPPRKPYSPPPPFSPPSHPPYSPPKTPAPPTREPPRRPYYSPSYTPNYPGPDYPPPPNTCDTSYDAISILRRELFIFKDEYMWRLQDRGNIQSGYPTLISQLWKNLPANFTHIDAVYEKYNGDIVFFIGREVYAYEGQKLRKGFPKPLTSLGLPAWLDHIDAALVWGHNGKTYFYSGKQYWRFDEEIQKVELDYPRNISVWKGIGDNIDAAFRWTDGITYFFKGKGFWKFNDRNLQVSNRKQTSSAEFWMGCPTSPVNLRESEIIEDETNEVQVDNLKNSLIVTHQYEILVVSVIVAILITISILVMVKRSKIHAYSRAKQSRNLIRKPIVT